jgi:CRISPR-associated protein Csm5
MNQLDYTLYRVQITTLTPLHIGTGRELLFEYDYAVEAGRTWRINETALLDAQDVDDPRMAAQLAAAPPTHLLTKEDYRPGSPFFRYEINGTPRSRQEGAQLREQLKDVRDRPYIPGSSLKGALRTALAWHGWQAYSLQPDRNKLDQGRPKFAARAYEQELFGRDPNHDLLRALQVHDSDPVEADRLLLINAQVVTASGAGSPIELEAIRPDTAFDTGLKLDRRLSSDFAHRAERGRFRLGGDARWLENLAAIVKAHAGERIKRQRAWHEERPGAERLADFYRDLGRLRLADNQFLLQLGWGGGWDSKTLGSRLEADPAFFEWVIGNYRLARGKRQKGDPFPKSRRVAMSAVRDRQGQAEWRPAAPLGWLVVEINQP